MTVKRLFDILPAIAKVAKQDLDIKTLYRVTKLFRKIDEEIVVFEKMRHDIMKRHCDIEEDKYIPRENEIDELNSEWAELESIESEIEIKEKISIPLDSKIMLSYNDMCDLEAFFDIEELAEEQAEA